MIVGSAQCVDVFLSCFAGIGEGYTAPSKSASVHLLKKQIGSQARVSAVTVREGVDMDELVMKPGGNFIEFVGLIFYPVADIVDELLQFGMDAVRVNADIFAG